MVETEIVLGLEAALDRLERHITQSDATPSSIDAARSSGSALHPEHPWAALCDKLALGQDHQHAFLLLASATWRPALYARMLGDAPSTPARLLRCIGGGLRTAALFAPRGPLCAAGLIRPIAPDVTAVELHTPVEATPTWLAWLCGARTLGPREAEVAERLIPSVEPHEVIGAATSVTETGWLVQRVFERPPPNAPSQRPEAKATPRGVALLVVGEPGTGRLLWTKAVATRAGRALMHVRGAALAEHPAGARRGIVRGLMRQAQYFEELLAISDCDVLCATAPDAMSELVAGMMRRKVVVVMLARDAGRLEDALSASVIAARQVMPRFDPAQRLELWRAHAGDPKGEATQSPPSRALAGLPQIGHRVRAAAGLLKRLADPTATLDSAMIETCLRAQAPITQARAKTRNSVQLGFDQLVLHDDTRRELNRVVDAIQVRRTVLDRWGFAKVIHRGTGIVCLFDGDPGTGKTLSAEVMARETGLMLNRVDVSTVVDKYIGETQKNLARIFAQADPRSELLLFDEADALFSKRTSVSKSTDRYSNMEINVLLQLIERYDGVVILTTNLAHQMDEAFERRIMFKIHYAMPDPKMRARLWRLHLPRRAPRARDVNLKALAWAYELGGGAIKNAALAAAYRAASQQRPICQDDLTTSAHTEAVAAGQLVRSPNA